MSRTSNTYTLHVEAVEHDGRFPPHMTVTTPAESPVEAEEKALDEAAACLGEPVEHLHAIFEEVVLAE